MKRLLIILMIVTETASASSVFLQKGAVTPYKGTLIAPETMRSIRVDLVKGDACKVENESLGRSMQLCQLNADLSKKQIDALTQSGNAMAERLDKTTNLSSWERMFWFGAGVIATGLAVKSAGELLK